MSPSEYSELTKAKERAADAHRLRKLHLRERIANGSKPILTGLMTKLKNLEQGDRCLAAMEPNRLEDAISFKKSKRNWAYFSKPRARVGSPCGFASLCCLSHFAIKWPLILHWTFLKRRLSSWPN